MKRSRVALCAVIAVVAAAGTVALTASAAERPAAGARQELLPDLRPITPVGLTTQIVDVDGVRQVHLGFYSAGENLGKGPLIVEGHRDSADVATMVADQVIMRANGEKLRRPDVGTFRYHTDASHEHWHLLRFMTYELRRASDFSLVVPDQKAGFCLGDRYNADSKTLTPGEPETRIYNSNCGPRQTELLGILEGISVGWGDVYEAWRDGQYLDITNVRAGTYVLVHRVNPDRALKELSYKNNASSVRISITWPNGRSSEPLVKLLRKCGKTARCPAR